MNERRRASLRSIRNQECRVWQAQKEKVGDLGGACESGEGLIGGGYGKRSQVSPGRPHLPLHAHHAARTLGRE